MSSQYWFAALRHIPPPIFHLSIPFYKFYNHTKPHSRFYLQLYDVSLHDFAKKNQFLQQSYKFHTEDHLYYLHN